MNPLVSVIIPCYNVEKYIEKCVDSVLNQTLKDIEIICVNDGSKDNTLEILNALSKKDPRIIIIDKANSGYGDSMNKGLQKAKGDYIGIVESDDFADLSMFETLYKPAKELSADIVKSDFWLYYGEDDRKEKSNYFVKSECGKLITPENFEFATLYRRKPSIWSAIYKRSFLIDNNIKFLSTPGASFQDTSFTFKVFSKMKRAFFIDKPLLYYRQDNVASSVNMLDKKHHCIFEEYEEIERYIKSLSKIQQDSLYPTYASAFYDTCMWAYERTSPSLQYSFLLNVQPVLKRLIEEIGVRNFRFQNEFWKYDFATQIAIDPFKWHTFRLVERYEQNGNTYIYPEATEPIPFTDIEKLKEERSNLKTPLFSIIIPVYNVEWYLRACLDSVIYQSVKNIEIICVNDGSTDNSLAILQEYAERDSRIVLVNQPNCGPSVARNAGLSIARGEHVIFMDSDDWIRLDACEKLVEKHAQYENPDIIVFGAEPFPLHPRASDWLYSVLNTPDAYYELLDEQSFFENPYFKIFMWRSCFSRSFLVDNGFTFNDEFKYGEDVLFAFETFLKAKGVAVISNKIYMYRHFRQQSLMNIISKNPLDWVDKQLDILSATIEVASKNGFKPSTEFLMYCLDFVYGCIDSCPSEHKIKYIRRVTELLEQNGLARFIDSAQEQHKGFWYYMKDAIKHDKLRYKIGRVMKRTFSKFAWSSRRQWHRSQETLIRMQDHQSLNMNEIRSWDLRSLHNKIETLEQQIVQLKKENARNSRLLNEQLEEIVRTLKKKES